MRNHVSFSASFPKEPDGGEPPGGLLAAIIAGGLAERGLAVLNLGTRETAHDFTITVDGHRYFAMLGLVDDGVREWLFLVEPKRGPLRLVLNGGDPAAHLEILETVHDVLSREPRVSDIRWYSDRDWTVEPDRHWAPQPTF